MLLQFDPEFALELTLSLAESLQDSARCGRQQKTVDFCSRINMY